MLHSLIKARSLLLCSDKLTRGERDHAELGIVLKATDCTLEQLTLSMDTLSAVLRHYLQAASAKLLNLRQGM